MPWPTRVNLNFFPVAKRVDSILGITGQRILATSAKTIRDSDYPYSFGSMASHMESDRILLTLFLRTDEHLVLLTDTDKNVFLPRHMSSTLVSLPCIRTFYHSIVRVSHRNQLFIDVKAQRKHLHSFRCIREIVATRTLPVGDDVMNAIGILNDDLTTVDSSDQFRRSIYDEPTWTRMRSVR